MEITNCEQYVLAELKAAQEENKHLAQEVERLQAQCGTLEAKLNAEPSKVERIVSKEGRKLVFDRWTGYAPNVIEDGCEVDFRDWCLEMVRDYSLPKGIGKSEFVEFFEPEFKECYEERLAEEAEA